MVVFFTSGGPSIAADLERGKEIYSRYCAWCHGESGEGNGPAANYLNPRPRDFTYGLYKWKSTPFDELTPGEHDFFRMLGWGPSRKGERWTGLAGTAMPGWKGVLTQDEMKDVIAYIKSFAELGAPEMPRIDLSGRVKPSIESFQRGKKLFADNCSECHGSLGRGNGKKRLKDDFGVRTWPRDLTKPWTFRGGSAPHDIYTRITVGILGTQMPSFDDPESKKRLNPGQRWDIVNYVVTLAEPRRKPQPGAVVSSVKLDGPLPETAADRGWEKAGFSSFFLAPQIIAPSRLFTPTVDSISVKSLYNRKEAAFLLEWDDRTESIPGQKSSIKLAEGGLFRDGVAMEFPLKKIAGAKKPHFAMGGPRSPVRILFWQGPTARSSERLSLVRARGYKYVKMKPASSDFFAQGVYDKGRWRVVIKGPLSAIYPGAENAQGKDVLIPIAFAAWDGSNNESGSRHTISGWRWQILRSESSASGLLLWPLIVFILVFIGEMVIAGALRGR